MAFSTIVQAGSGASTRILSASICALVGNLSPSAVVQTNVVTLSQNGTIVTADSVASTLSALTTPPASGLFTQVNGQPARVMVGGFSDILPFGTANSQIVLHDGTSIYVTGTPTATAIVFANVAPIFTPGQIIGVARFNADGTLATSENIEAAGGHTTGNYVGTLISGTCTSFAALVSVRGTGNYTPLVNIQADATNATAFVATVNLASDGTTRTDHAFTVVLVCIDP